VGVAIKKAMEPGRKNRPQNIAEFLLLLEGKVEERKAAEGMEDTDRTKVKGEGVQVQPRQGEKMEGVEKKVELKKEIMLPPPKREEPKDEATVNMKLKEEGITGKRKDSSSRNTIIIGGIITLVSVTFLMILLWPQHTNLIRNASIPSSVLDEISQNMLYVEGGTFMMGNGDRGVLYSNYTPSRKVTVNSFYISKYEVTQKQWETVIGKNPSKFKGENLPVETVSWNDAQEFILKLNTLTGKKYRLPTEAEWEYAARGGNQNRAYMYSGSNDLKDVAWYNYNSRDSTHPVGEKSPNELGLYDMSGNVWEWCYDWFGNYNSNTQTNPQGPSSGSFRLLCGGGWSSDSQCCHPAYRGFIEPSSGDSVSGFRLAADL